MTVVDPCGRGGTFEQSGDAEHLFPPSSVNTALISRSGSLRAAKNPKSGNISIVTDNARIPAFYSGLAMVF